MFSALLTALIATAPASAEWYVEPYAGIAISDVSDVKITAPGDNFTLSDRDTKDSFAIGARGGYWTEFAGLGLDFFYHQPDIKRQTATVPGFGSFSSSADVKTYGIGLDVLFRLPLLKSESLPQGRVQPYVAVGPVLFITDADAEVDNLGIEDTATSVGVKVGAGLAAMLTRNIGLFAEYRFSHHRPEFESNGVKLEADFNTHYGLVGLAIRF